MKVERLMTRDVQTCRPESDLSAVAMQMWNWDCGVVPVVSSGKVVGMITDRDICIAAATKHRDVAKIRVNEVARGQEVYSCSPADDVQDALKLMKEKRVRRLPVINAETGELAGILSMNDVALNAQPEATNGELCAQEVEETLKAICTHPIRTLAEPLKEFAPPLPA